MIISIRHKALKNYWVKGHAKGLNPQWLTKIDIILDALDAATQPNDMNVIGFYFHTLSGQQVGRYSVRVTGNWRITFEFEGENASIVDLEDYH